METKVLQVFYGKDGLPYKDKERSVHFPIVGTGFLGASNTTKIKFYYDELDETNQTTWVAVSKLPNGKIGSRVLESYTDETLNEHYALLELDSFYTQYKGDVFISLQGYQGGVQVDFDEETQLYTINGTPTIAATGSVKFTINYANQFVGSGQTDNITLQRILADLGTKLGIRARSEHVDELPTVGESDVFYVINNDLNDPNKANIYIWNAISEHYVWVGDNSLDLGDYYTQEQGDQFEESIDNRVTSVEDELSSVVSGAPSGVYATLSDLTAAFPSGNNKIYVVLADGKWYYWNSSTSAWTAGGVYLSTGNAVPDTRKVANIPLSSDIPKSTLKNSLSINILETLGGIPITLMESDETGYFDNSGVYQQASNFHCKKFFAYGIYKITFTNARSAQRQVFLFDKDNVLIGSYGGNTQSYEIFIPSNCYYIALNFWDQTNHTYDNGFTLYSKRVNDMQTDSLAYLEKSASGIDFTISESTTKGYYDNNGVFNSGSFNSEKIYAFNIRKVSWTNSHQAALYQVLFFDKNDDLIIGYGGEVQSYEIDVPQNCSYIAINLFDQTGHTYDNGFTFISNKGTIIDTTLQISGAAADAKTVGDIFDEIANGKLSLKYYLDPKVYSGAFALNSTKTYTDTSVTFSYSVGTNFNGVIFGTNTQSPVSLTSGIKAQLVLEFDATFDSDTLQVTLAGTGGVFLSYPIVSGHNKVVFDLTSNPTTTINYIYFRETNNAQVEHTLEVSNIILYQGSQRLTLDIYEQLKVVQNVLKAQGDENPFANKKILTIGDSLTNSSGDGLHWQTFVVDKFSMSGYVTGGGAGLTVANQGDNSIYSHVMALDEDSNVELITFWGGTNDWNSSIPLGDFDTQKVASTRDNTTFYGALFDCVEKIMTLYPTKPLMLVGTTQRINDYAQCRTSNESVNSQGLKLPAYVDAVKKVAEFYSLPFMDLYHSSNVNKYSMTTYMFEQTSGGVSYYLHFSGDGQKHIAKKFIEFIKRYFL